MVAAKNEMDLSTGSLPKLIIRFVIPQMLSGILQLLYNAADTIVVGRYVGSTALAAVGSTGSLTNLIINLFVGLSVGASVVVAQYYGAKDHKNVSQTVHTAMGISVIFGIIASAVGISMAKFFLRAMGTPEEVLPYSTIYMQIYFAGMTASMIFNFGSSILRAVGDTKRPFIFLTISGGVNVILNLIFVIDFNMGVAGVALSTIISQVLSAVLVVLSLLRSEGSYRLNIREIRIYKDKLLKMMRIGIPAGLQGSIFSVSNVLIQSSVNSFGEAAMAGNTAASNIDGLIYIACNSFYHASLSFTGQNVGARKYERINRILAICVTYALIVGAILGVMAFVCGETLLSFFAPDNAEVVKYGMIRVSIMGVTYFTCGIMETLVGSLRGMGASIMPMIVSVMGVVGVRIAWVYTFFVWNRTLRTLYISYPASWIMTSLAHLACFLFFKKRLLAKMELKTEQAAVSEGSII